jgi:endonuclease III
MFRSVAGKLREEPHQLEVFQPEFLARQQSEADQIALAARIRALGIHRQNEMADRWMRTSVYLVENGYKSPVELLRNSGSVTQFLRDHSRAHRIVGLAGKTASLLAIFYRELGWLDNVHDAFPVDIWVARICRQTGVLVGEGYWLNEGIERVLRPKLAGFCRRNKIDPTILNGLMWRLGATLCRKGPRCLNAFCPIEHLCLGFARGATPHHKGSRGGIRGMDLSARLVRRPLALSFPRRKKR